ncbi:MAG: carboxypeptidase-like regulatory domain-containing protein [Fulvivirga sp.]|uniref:TonB-dependent receptor n=1 Tax=Fulvivirga sp. TaxID=1931237 RepID=UPI0032EC2970
MRGIITGIALLFFVSTAKGQNVDFRVPEHKIGVSLTEFLNEIEEKEYVKFFFLPEWTAQITVSTSYKDQPIATALQSILAGRSINIEYIYDYGIALIKDPTADIIRQEILDNIDGDLIRYTIGDSVNANWGSNVRIRGIIKDEKFNEPLVGITIYANEVQKGTATGADGSYSLTLPVGKHIITYAGLNYQDKNIAFSLYESGKYDVIMEEKPITLDEIVVKDNAEKENFESNVVGRTRITAAELQTIPAFLGEIDVIKSIQLLPGVNSVGEGSAGFNVRGGSVDQNLILLDEGIIFNPNHLFGFFSAFHPDALKEVTFYRGAIPAQYGGRISSVLDVRQKDGDRNEYHGSGGLGIVTSRLMVEGPIAKDKVSFLFAGRTSYSDWLLKQVKNDDVRNSEAFFYDVTGKVTAYINKKNKIAASYYLSNDKFKFSNDTAYYWQNHSASITHESYVNQKLSLFNNFSVGNYNYEVRDEDVDESFSWKYSIDNFQFKSYINYAFEKHLLTAGVDVKGYDFARGDLKPLSSSSNVRNIELNNDRSLEAGVFISDEMQVGNNLIITPGLRYSFYRLFGDHQLFKYNPELPRDDFEIIDTVNYDNGEVAASYSGLEPRLSAKYSLDANNFIKAGFSRSYQYIHLLSNTTAITPIDSWVPSSEYIKPQIGNQYSIGYFKRMPVKKLTASVEVFYKQIDNVPEYKDGAQLALKQNIETELVNSEADIRGLEFSIQKDGRLSGEFNYTYTSSRRRTFSQFESLQVNNNEFFPANYDQPHNIKINANYDISRRHVLSFNFNLASGRPITAPVERFEIDGVLVANYTERNQYRIPTYHRLDVSLLIRTNHKKDKKWEGSWSFTLYNVYSRRNAYSVFFQESESGRPTAYKLSVLGSIFPSITYNFKF